MVYFEPGVRLNYFRKTFLFDLERFISENYDFLNFAIIEN